MMSRKLAFVLVIVVLALVVGIPSLSAQEAEGGAEGGRGPLAIGLIALSAALAVGLTAIATGIAQSRIGAAGSGTIAEKPDSAGTIIVLVAIPETMVILGFVVSVVMLFTL